MARSEHRLQGGDASEHHPAVTEEKLQEVKAVLEAIRDYEHPEIAYDKFAYERLQEAYREAARIALKLFEEESTR